MDIVVLAGHGSRAAEANAAVGKLAADTAAAIGSAVRPAFLEMAEPTIPQAIAAAVADGATRIVVVPYFLQPGMHVRRDLVEIVAEARIAHRGTAIELGDFLGQHPALPQLVADLARSALRPGE